MYIAIALILFIYLVVLVVLAAHFFTIFTIKARFLLWINTMNKVRNRIHFMIRIGTNTNGKNIFYF